MKAIRSEVLPWVVNFRYWATAIFKSFQSLLSKLSLWLVRPRPLHSHSSLTLEPCTWQHMVNNKSSCHWSHQRGAFQWLVNVTKPVLCIICFHPLNFTFQWTCNILWITCNQAICNYSCLQSDPLQKKNNFKSLWAFKPYSTFVLISVPHATFIHHGHTAELLLEWINVLQNYPEAIL